MSLIDEIMTPAEVAVYLKLPEETVLKLAASGSLPVLDLGGELRFKKSVLERWLSEQAKLPRTTELAMAVSADTATAGPLSSLLRENTISTRLAAATRDGVLRELAALVPLATPRFRQTLFDALKAREELCSTATTDGVAIPHARNAMVGLVSEPVMAFGRHPQGVDFGALDGKPTHLFFLPCAPNVRLHLQMLARLARLLRSKTVRDALLKADKPAEVIQIIRSAETP